MLSIISWAKWVKKVSQSTQKQDIIFSDTLWNNTKTWRMPLRVVINCSCSIIIQFFIISFNIKEILTWLIKSYTGMKWPLRLFPWKSSMVPTVKHLLQLLRQFCSWWWITVTKHFIYLQFCHTASLCGSVGDLDKLKCIIKSFPANDYPLFSVNQTNVGLLDLNLFPVDERNVSAGIGISGARPAESNNPSARGKHRDWIILWCNQTRSKCC